MTRLLVLIALALPLAAQNAATVSGKIVDDTGAGVPDLKALQALQHLGLDSTRITDAGVKELKQALPKADVTGP